MPRRMDEARRRRIAKRYTKAAEAARQILQHLEGLGCDGWVFGSMTEPERFHEASDIDILVACPSHLKYRIESDCVEIAADIPIEIVYRDELREPWLSRALSQATKTLRGYPGST